MQHQWGSIKNINTNMQGRAETNAINANKATTKSNKSKVIKSLPTAILRGSNSPIGQITSPTKEL